MAITLEKVERLMDDATKNIVSDSGLWRTFLNTSSYMYKYSFANQMAIYAQRADATACTDYKSWNKLDRYVVKGSKGIRLVEESIFTESNYVFNVSDTKNQKNENRKLRLWELSPVQYPLIENFLDETFDLYGEEFIDKLAEAVKQVVSDNLVEYMEGYYENNKEKADVYKDIDRLWNLATNSAVYIVFKRANLLPVPERYTDFDLSALSDLEKYDDISDFGNVVTESARNILTEIEKNVKKDIAKSRKIDYNLEKEKEERRRDDNGIDIQTGRGLPDSELDTTRTAGGGYREIRKDEEDLSDGAQERITFPSISARNTETTPDGHRQGSLGNEREISEANAGEGSGSRQDGGSDGLGTASEYDHSSGGGDYTKRPDIQQLSLFPTEEEQRALIDAKGAEETAPFSVGRDEELLEYIINTNYSEPNGKSRIASMIATRQNDEEIKKVALKNMAGGKGIIYNDQKYALWTDETGIKYAKGERVRFNNFSQSISWDEVVRRIKNGLAEGTYLTSYEIENMVDLERSELVTKLNFLYGDMRDDAYSLGYLDTLKEVRTGSYPDMNEKLNALLKDKNRLFKLREELLDFHAAYKEDRSLMRFHFHNIPGMLQSVDMILGDRVAFQSTKTVSEEATLQTFITGDEIDADLLQGNSYSGGKRVIYNAFINHSYENSFADFLKKEYGVGGHSSPNRIGEMHDPKGIAFEKAGCEKVSMTWNQVAKRIGELIDADIYYPPELSIERDEAEIVMINGQECVKTDEWQSDDESYIVGSTDDGEFFYASVNGSDFFEYDYEPERSKVEDDYLNKISERDIDEHEAKVGIEGVAERPEDKDNQESQLLHGSTDKYGIYQLKQDQLSRFRFEGTESLMRMGVLKDNYDEIKQENYELVYVGELSELQGQTQREMLSAAYEKFNISRPEDFTGHSLSVSDIVVLHQDGKNSSHFVDSFGFTELPNFTKDLEGVKEQEIEKADKTADFKKKTKELFHEISEMGPEDIEEIVRTHVQAKITEYDIDAKIVDVVVAGSRCRGLERPDSDLDVVVELVAGEREDDLFNAFNEDGIRIGDVKVDINPITAQRSGTLETYLPAVERYLETVKAERESNFVSNETKLGVKVEKWNYSVGDEVYIDDTRFVIEEISSREVQLRDTSLMYPIFRAEKIARFEELLDKDLRNSGLIAKEETLAFQIADRYISIQGIEDGYDYSIMGADYKEIDGGVYDNPDVTIREALKDIIDDLKQQPDYNGAKGSITERDELVPIDYDDLMEQVEQANQTTAKDFREKAREVFGEAKLNTEKIEEAIKDAVESFSNASTKEETGVIVTFTVAESGEHHGLGEFYEGILTAEDAVNVWKQIPPERMHGLPSIGIRVHREGEENYLDEIDLVLGKKIDLSILEYVPQITNEPIAMKAIEELVAMLPDLEIDGKLPNTPDRLQVRVEWSESPAFNADIKAGTNEYSFGMANELLSILDRMQAEQLGYDKTNLFIEGTLNGQPYSYDYRFEIGDNIGSLLEQLKETDMDDDALTYLEEHLNTTEEEDRAIESKIAIVVEQQAAREAAGKEISSSSNFVIQNEDLGVGSNREKLDNNILAIKTLKQIEAENRNATPDEQQILSKYVGWGGLADVFDETKYLYSHELKTILTADEYRSAMDSVLNSHYTAPVIIDSIYNVLEDMGFKGGNILEPACGVGNFFGKMPTEMFENSKIAGVELDSISGRIAQMLYPDASISIKGFEESAFPDESFDVAIGNVPFGNYGIADKKYDKHSFKIHDYFFAKAIDQVRPGGVIAFITSKGTLDKKSEQVRRYIGERAQMLGAIRLPNTAFKANAGTEVTSDIIFLQKRERPVICEDEWLGLGTDDNGLTYNSYFIDHPEMVIGSMKEVSGPFGAELTCELENPEEYKERLKLATRNIKGYITDAEHTAYDEPWEEEDNTILADPSCPNYSYTVIDDKVYFRENSLMTLSSKNATAIGRIKGLIEVRDLTRNLIDAQTKDASEDEIEALQSELNQTYDTFTSKYGLINSKGNDLAFRDDASYPLICSLEKIDDDGNLISKADIFTKRTIKVKKNITHVEEAREALALSLSEKGQVDIDYICSLTDKTKEDVLDDLTGIIYRVPDIHNPEAEVYQTAAEYLSGNIREKMTYANLLVGQYPEYQVNLDALKRVMPKPLDASEIDVRLGATWVPTEYYLDFMEETLGTPSWMISRNLVNISYSEVTSTWNIQGKSSDRGSVAANVTYGTQRANAYRILEDALNLRSVRITDTIIDAEGNEKTVTNAKETTLANQKQDLLKEKFKEWIWQDPDRREELCRIYNERFNSNVTREYDGSFLEFPGMNISIALKDHQKRAVARQVYGGNTLLAHCVGAGKTYEMVAAIMEKKRLGLANKAMLVVPNHLTGQWASEFMELYPTANILAVNKRDFQPMNRKKFCSRIATGDYDAIIIGHSQFEMLPLSKERQVEFIREQIEDITNELEELKYVQSGKSFTVKQLTKTRKDLETKLKKLNDGSRKDNVIDFEQLGIDSLYVDEAHGFKNLALQTKMRNIAGIQTTGANKSYDMFAKCRYIDEVSGGKGITFATGTPVSNSMSELYTLQKYLQYGKLRRMNMVNFDSWASTFGETTTSYELSPEGTGYRQKSRFSKFFNLPELMTAFKEVADIQTADMLKLDVPDSVTETVVLKPSPLQKALLQDLAVRAESVRNNEVDSTVDNMLKITTDGRKLALDERLYQDVPPELEIQQELDTELRPKTKIEAVVEKCMYHYVEGMAQKSAQLIFCDLATPKKDGSYSVYDEIKKSLVEKGVPEEEIAYIHDANTEARKTELFSKVRQGKVRFLLGSTSKMGAGMNVQNKLIALHHVDVPWKPSDIEQREGRIVRQGNENEKVHIYRYVTENTFDAYSWQLIENKQKFIGQIMTSKSPVRSCDDIDEVALSYAEVKALATGNPYIKEKMELDNEVSRLKVMKSNFLSERYRLQDDLLKRMPVELLDARKMVQGLEKDIEYLKDFPVSEEDGFSMKVGQVTVTEKKDAGFAIIDAGLKCKANNSEMHIGEYRGFDVKVKNSVEGAYLVLSHHVKLTCDIGSDPVGMITRMNNVIDSLPQKMDLYLRKAEEIEKQMKNAEIELEKPFAKEEELKVKLARLEELDVLLAVDKDKTKGLSLDNSMPNFNKTEMGRRTFEAATAREAAGMERE